MCRYLLILLLFLISCSTQNVVDGSGKGSGTNTGNAISASFVYENGTVAKLASVRIRPVDYLATPGDKSWLIDSNWANTQTDTNGLALLKGVPLGQYVLEANDEKGFALQFMVDYSDTSKTLELNNHTLLPTSKITGLVPVPNNTSESYIQLKGLEYSANVDLNSWYYELKGIPSGAQTVRGVAIVDQSFIEDSVSFNIDPKDSVDVGQLTLDSSHTNTYRNWRYTGNMSLNTTVSGVTVNNTIYNYPLYVELNLSNFPFDSATQNGGDIRFTNLEDKALPYELEKWDLINKKASLWVRIDSINPNSENQFIRMHWGNGTIGDLPNADYVFSKQENYKGVWHMNDVGFQGNIIEDASEDRNNGYFHEIASGFDNSGLFGDGISLDGKFQYMSTTSLDTNPNLFSLSFWFKSTSDSGGKIFGFGYPSSGPEQSNFERHVWISDSGSLHYGVFMDSNFMPAGQTSGYQDSVYQEGIKVLSSEAGFNDGNWHFVTASLSSTHGIELFVDGVLKQADPSATYGANRSGYWRAGYGLLTNKYWVPKPTTLYYRGQLDEIRVHYQRHTADRVLLDYETQKQGSTVLKLLR